MMMTEFLKIFLLLYFIVYFGLTFVLKSLIVAKKIGKSPLVLPKDDSAYGLIGKYFKWLLLLMFAYILCFAFDITFIETCWFFMQKESVLPIFVGIFLLLFALVWTIIAQANMRNAWRIGIDNETPTELITDGLFKYSRNPVFTGMFISLLGLFILLPNVFTLIFGVLGYVLIQIQTRMEEEHLGKIHGQQYIEYKQRVRRF